MPTTLSRLPRSSLHMFVPPFHARGDDSQPPTCGAFGTRLMRVSVSGGPVSASSWCPSIQLGLVEEKASHVRDHNLLPPTLLMRAFCRRKELSLGRTYYSSLECLLGKVEDMERDTCARFLVGGSIALLFSPYTAGSGVTPCIRWMLVRWCSTLCPFCVRVRTRSCGL